MQEVFVIAFRGLANFRHEAQLATWLYRICVNVAFGRMRSRGRRPPPIAVADLEQHPSRRRRPTSPESPERALERREDAGRAGVRGARAAAAEEAESSCACAIEGRDLRDRVPRGNPTR